MQHLTNNMHGLAHFCSSDFVKYNFYKVRFTVRLGHKECFMYVLCCQSTIKDSHNYRNLYDYFVKSGTKVPLLFIHVA